MIYRWFEYEVARFRVDCGPLVKSPVVKRSFIKLMKEKYTIADWLCEPLIDMAVIGFGQMQMQRQTPLVKKDRKQKKHVALKKKLGLKV